MSTREGGFMVVLKEGNEGIYKHWCGVEGIERSVCDKLFVGEHVEGVDGELCES